MSIRAAYAIHEEDTMYTFVRAASGEYEFLMITEDAYGSYDIRSVVLDNTLVFNDRNLTDEEKTAIRQLEKD